MAESMKDFETELEQSFQVIKEGDVLEVEVIGISETELTVDLNYYTEGIIPLEECSDDPAFSIKNDCNIGDRIQAMVIDAENENGVVILSKKAAHKAACDNGSTDHNLHRKILLTNHIHYFLHFHHRRCHECRKPDNICFFTNSCLYDILRRDIFTQIHYTISVVT